MSITTSGSDSTRVSASDPKTLRAGDRIADVYILKSIRHSEESELTVWLAEDEVSGEEVALHFVPPEVVGDTKLRDALKAEVRRTRQMIHPNILRVRDFVNEEDLAAVVTDSYDGQTLLQLASRGGRGFLEARDMEPLLRTILQTVSDAHRANLLHRNLSPSSIIVSEDGHVFLSGFGVSRLIADAVTRAGIKTPAAQKAYSCTSPNIVNDGLAGISDDLYSFGATLFQLFTGRPAFWGTDIVQRILSEKAPLISEARANNKISGEPLFKNWEKVVALCLSKNPSERPSSMFDVGVQLGLLGDQKAVEPVAPPPKAEPEPAAPEPAQAEAEEVVDELEELDEAPEEDPNDRFSASPRPIFIPTSSSPVDESERGNRTALFAGLLLLAAAAGVWVGTNILMKQDEEADPEPETAEKPAMVAKTDEPPPVRFIPPPIGSEDEGTLRPGLPLKPKRNPENPNEVEPQDSAAPVTVEPPATSVPQGATAPRMAGKHTVEQEIPDSNATKLSTAVANSPVEEPVAGEKKALDSALSKKEKEALNRLTSEAEARAKDMLEKAAANPISKTGKDAKPVQFTPADRQRLESAHKAEMDLYEARRTLALARGEQPPPAPAPLPPDPAVEAGGVVENSIGMRFVPVGNALFSVYETRVKDYAMFIKETGHAKSAWRNPGFDQNPDHPVVRVSWTDAMSFCQWLSDREHMAGALPADEFYRLPSDLEWSYAAGLSDERGLSPELRDMGVLDVYPWGKDWPPKKGTGNYTGEETGSDVAIVGFNDGFPYTSPVGSFTPNEKGLYDMGGNTWEWVLDTWNPKARSRVLRGASWFQGSLQLSLLASCRVHSMPDRETDNYGFRVIRTSAPAKTR